MITAFLSTLFMLLASAYVVAAAACYLTIWWLFLFTDEAKGFSTIEKIQLATVYPAVLPFLWVLQT